MGDRDDSPLDLVCEERIRRGPSAGSPCTNTARFTYRQAPSGPRTALCSRHARRFAGQPGLHPIGASLELTERERAAMRLFSVGGDSVILEGWLDGLWPLIRRPRAIVDSLLVKRLVTLGAWHDEERRYELHLTAAGADLLPCAYGGDGREHPPGPHARCCVCASATCDACGEYHDDGDGEDWYCPDDHPARTRDPGEEAAGGDRV